VAYVPVVSDLGSPDVLVCGAGCAGVAAAIAAARLGASTMVVDRLGFAGGYMTSVGGAGLDGFIDLRSGLPIVGGVAFEFVRTAGRFEGDVAGTAFHASDDLREWQETPTRKPLGFNLELFKLYADRLLLAAGSKIMYHTQIVDVLSESGRVTGVVVGNKGGLGILRPKVVVDATGDADVAAWAGAPYEIHDEHQPMGLHFRVADVPSVTPTIRDRCAEVLKAAHARGELGLYGGPWISWLESGELNFNATRILGNGTNPADITAAEIRGRSDAHVMFDLFKAHLPEFKDAHLVLTGPSVGVRESRRVTGISTLRVEDIEGSREPEDVVSMGAWWLDRHPRGKSGYHVHAFVRPYGIAYGTLVPQGFENLWVAGRCHSAESAALASSRVTITAMGMGQAAGTAAALAVQAGVGATELSIPTLQRRLLDDGAIILDRANRVLELGDRYENVPASMPR